MKNLKIVMAALQSICYVFIGIDESKDKIFNLAGVHHLPEVSNNAWRCLFRGAQLPGYNLRNNKQ